MSEIYPDPGDPAVVAAILKHQRSLTREQWLKRLARIPGIAAEMADQAKATDDASSSENKSSFDKTIDDENNHEGDLLPEVTSLKPARRKKVAHR